ncbi:hypothetical protein J1N35_043588 [Gossypium stocksii]|uniref:Uncharacterized protein n=1 Tax=Gossypium stocksii TaxID=47602 RepID=A0A9D3ZF64_9ROSI|nr:hypothetical protein J1N35_043588 [Gossypium stocksii]
MHIQPNLCMQSKLSKACMLLPNHHNSSFSPAYLSELYLLSNKSRPLHCPPLIHFSINKKVPRFYSKKFIQNNAEFYEADKVNSIFFSMVQTIEFLISQTSREFIINPKRLIKFHCSARFRYGNVGIALIFFYRT